MSRPSCRRQARSAIAAAILTLGGAVAGAQVLPSGPLTLANGRAVLGGDVAASIGPDDLGFFNYSDYQHSTLREVRLGLTASFRATDWVSFLGEIRSENFDQVQPFALYARLRPWQTRRFDVQVGRIPPTFGAFTRHAYGHENPLIGYPLAYQYLTSLRTDSIPRNADELVRMRGRGWLSVFGAGNQEPNRGLPLVTVFSWDTGAQVHTEWRALDVTASLTNGSVSNPRVGDDNRGKQVAARVVLRPAAGLLVGTSFARGEFLERQLAEVAGARTGSGSTQLAAGLDLEYSRDHWVVRSDTVLSEWNVPILGIPPIRNPLRALATSLEGRYTFRPGLYAAARLDRLTFNAVATSTQPIAWEAPVTRVEIGGGVYLQRNLIARFSVQVNRRDGGRVTRSTLPSAQLLYWF